jgi:hypothetical protein
MSRILWLLAGISVFNNAAISSVGKFRMGAVTSLDDNRRPDSSRPDKKKPSE